MIEIGIDEFTVVLQLNDFLKSEVNTQNWHKVARSIIEMFSDKVGMIEVFGEINPVNKKLPAGYTNGFEFGIHDFYVMAAYHEYRFDMGIVIKFSAQALGYYCDSKGVKPYSMLQMAQDDNYTVRLSRVDLTVDYINEGLSVTKLYKRLIQKKVAVFREEETEKNNDKYYRRVDLQIKGICRGDSVPTIYLGSPRSSVRLRVYDKRLEQIERKGNKLDKTINCADWVRFEGVFRNEYAHQIGMALLNMKNDEDYIDLIASTMLQKYRFKNINKGVAGNDTRFTKKLISCIRTKSCILRSDISRNYDLARSIKYLIDSSGLVSTLYKIISIWGEEKAEEFYKLISKEVSEYVPNEDVYVWLRKNQAEYMGKYPDFSAFIASIVPSSKKP